MGLTGNYTYDLHSTLQSMFIVLAFNIYFQ